MTVGGMNCSMNDNIDIQTLAIHPNDMIIIRIPCDIYTVNDAKNVLSCVKSALRRANLFNACMVIPSGINIVASYNQDDDEKPATQQELKNFLFAEV